MPNVKVELQPSRGTEVIHMQKERGGPGEADLARLIWTTVLLRRMRSAAQRAARAEERAPIETVMAARGLRRRPG
jgi:hypothetical protein